MRSKLWLARANDAAELGGREVTIWWMSSGGSRLKQLALATALPPSCRVAPRGRWIKVTICLKKPEVADIALTGSVSREYRLLLDNPIY